MNNFTLKLQILTRSEMALAQIRGRRTASRSGLFFVAMIFALLALTMLNLALFHLLSPSQGPALAAFWLSLSNIVVAIVVLLRARNAGPSRSEEQLAKEMRDLAYAELNNDFEAAKEKLSQLTNDVSSIRSNFMGIAGSTSNALGPIMGLLLKAVKKKSSKTKSNINKRRKP